MNNASTPKSDGNKPAAPATSVGAGHLKVVPAVKGKLSPAQQRFNTLLAKVDKLGSKIKDFECLADKVRGPHLAQTAELDRQVEEGQKQMIFFLHERLQRKGLTRTQQRMAREILESLLPHPQETDDEAMLKLCALYGSNISAEEQAEEQAEDLRALRESMLSTAESVLGRPLDRKALEGITSPLELMEALSVQVEAHQQAEQERAAARRAKRPPTERQRKAQAQEQDAKTMLRTIYRQLASALHPDRETDPAEHDRKHTLMVQVNTAYERGDLISLLRLQLEIEQVDADHVARMAEDKIAVLSLLLKQQVATLEDNLMAAEMRLSSELGFKVSASMTEPVLLRLLKSYQETLADYVKEMYSDLERVRDDTQFKRWLREQQALEDAAQMGSGPFFF